MALLASPLVCFITNGSASSNFLRRARPLPSLRHSSLPIKCSSASFSEGGQAAEPNENPYKVLGVNPFESFDKVKAAYAKRQKDAEKRGDEATLSRIESAYDKIMMAQLANRKQGLTFGSFQVSKDIKYADKQPIVPWGPRYAPSSKRDILINLAISAVFGLWIISTQSADWKPFQFLIFGYMWRVFDKLQHYEKAEPFTPSEEEDGEGKRTSKGGKRLLRTLGLVFSCVAVCSLAYTGILNGIELLGQYIPRFLINSQELIVTIATSILLFFVGSYYR
ncbi:hypothetical protein GOP47_0015302 [Adiantum capillus-veneris]|uniref:Uncharacterized protein n=1 Tax=Adiantum capillus-veneris TaxID=13818 RepID=A0A9D4UKD2_ADICA|nr:hypothetical protein GOP47_0015302 [Adiantum capillus-veneris]